MMELKDAWLTLGKDPNEIFAKISTQSSVASKIETVMDLLDFAKIISRKLLAQNHPDRNPGDIEAENRFKRIQQALQSIEHHSNEFKIKASLRVNDEKKGSCYIQFK